MGILSAFKRVQVRLLITKPIRECCVRSGAPSRSDSIGSSESRLRAPANQEGRLSLSVRRRSQAARFGAADKAARLDSGALSSCRPGGCRGRPAPSGADEAGPLFRWPRGDTAGRRRETVTWPAGASWRRSNASRRSSSDRTGRSRGLTWPVRSLRGRAPSQLGSNWT